MAAITAVATLVKNNPVLSAALVNFAVFVGGYFGLHVTGVELIYYVGVITTVLGVLSRALVVPTAKLPAGVVVPPDVSSAPATVLPSAAQGLMPVVTNTHTESSRAAQDVATDVMGDSKSDSNTRVLGSEGSARSV